MSKGQQNFDASTLMRGSDLKKWRESRGWKQSDLMAELDVQSRQTISSWEASEQIPRLVELAIIALDQVEECRRQVGYERQFTREKIANRWVVEGQKYIEEGRLK